MRVPVVDNVGKPVMPCKPAKARHLIKSGQALPARSKVGIFYIQLTYEIAQPNNQPLVIGIDPGSTYESYSVAQRAPRNQDTVLNIMAEAPTHVKDAVEVRRNMRRARRQRKTWRRQLRSNRLCHQLRIPPSTRSRWEAKARIVAQLCKILPLTDAIVEDVQAVPHKRNGGQWNSQFSPIQVGKEHLYYLLQKFGLALHKNEGHQTANLRVRYGLKKSKSKSKQSFDSHCVDSWVMAASLTGASQPTERRLYYTTEIRLYRRQLHRFQPEKGGIRKPYAPRRQPTRSFGLKRGTLVNHPKYGLCSVGGFDSKKGRISLNAYADNKRLTQGAKASDCQIKTFSPYRTKALG